MKLIVKILIALAILGAVLLGIGLLQGGELYTSLQNGELVALNGRFDSASAHGTVSVIDYENIDTLHINIRGGKADITTGTDLRCSNEVDLDLDDRTLTLTVDGGDADIVLPEKSFGCITLDIAGGKLEADRLNAVSRTEDDSAFGEISVNLSGGAAEIEQLWARIASVNVSLGDLEIEQLDAMINADLNLSAGKLSAEQLYSEQTTASCMGGSMELGLPYEPETYRCTAEISAGACTWNGNALKSADFGGAGAKNSLDLTVSAGTINLHRADRD